MPHQVVKAATHGSVGDLAKITKALRDIQTTPAGGVNIRAIGGGEGRVSINGADEEVGVITMILEPDEGPLMATILDTLRTLDLGGGRQLHDVQAHPNIHIELPDTPGELTKALDAIGDVNILSVLSMGSILGTAHVGLGFVDDAARQAAVTNLEAQNIVVHPADD